MIRQSVYRYRSQPSRTFEIYITQSTPPPLQLACLLPDPVLAAAGSQPCFPDARTPCARSRLRGHDAPTKRLNLMHDPVLRCQFTRQPSGAMVVGLGEWPLRRSGGRGVGGSGPLQAAAIALTSSLSCQSGPSASFRAGRVVCRRSNTSRHGRRQADRRRGNPDCIETAIRCSTSARVDRRSVAAQACAVPVCCLAARRPLPPRRLLRLTPWDSTLMGSWATRLIS